MITETNRHRVDHDAHRPIARPRLAVQFGAHRCGPGKGWARAASDRRPNDHPANRDTGEGPMKYDLLLTGGEGIDPGAGLRGLMDIGISGGKIAAVAPSLPASDALRSISVKGKLLTPGLVDIHAHV